MEDCKKKAKRFHSIVAKMLFVTKRARPDTGPAISYLTTRVREPNEDDLSKLAHSMKHIRGTLKLPLTIGANRTGVLKWCIYGSYGAHPNMRGRSGGGLCMGKGFPISASTKQKLNTRSSIRTELVSVDDFMPGIIWTRNFLEAQEYGVRENIIFQDKRSAMLMEKGGKVSSDKRTKHINIRFFLLQIESRRKKCRWTGVQPLT